jgi:large-conductance mechanosensitive channel
MSLTLYAYKKQAVKFFLNVIDLIISFDLKLSTVIKLAIIAYIIWFIISMPSYFRKEKRKLLYPYEENFNNSLS